MTKIDKFWQTVGMLRAGKSRNWISKTLCVDKKTVRAWRKRWKENGSLERTPGSGRPRTTSEREDRNLLRITKQNPFSSGYKPKKQSNFSGSIRTLRRRLNRMGLRSRRLIHVPRLTERHRRDRLEWAMRRCLWREAMWSQIIWTDESRFSLYHRDGRLRVWRTKGQASAMKFTHPVVQGDGGSVHVWGAIWMNGKSNLVFLSKNVNGEVYRDIIQSQLLPLSTNMPS